jgi:hypothetical protein
MRPRALPQRRYPGERSARCAVSRFAFRPPRVWAPKPPRRTPYPAVRWVRRKDMASQGPVHCGTRARCARRAQPVQSRRGGRLVCPARRVRRRRRRGADGPGHMTPLCVRHEPWDAPWGGGLGVGSLWRVPGRAGPGLPSIGFNTSYSCKIRRPLPCTSSVTRKNGLCERQVGRSRTPDGFSSAARLPSPRDARPHPHPHPLQPAVERSGGCQHFKEGTRALRHWCKRSVRDG